MGRIRDRLDFNREDALIKRKSDLKYFGWWRICGLRMLWRQVTTHKRRAVPATRLQVKTNSGKGKARI